MNKRIVLLLIIFLIFPHLVYSATTFVIQETEKISLVPNAADPDADKLTITYAPPLNENGEWQTGYGDAGEHKTTITVSDGVTETSQEVLIVVNKKEESPKIDSFSPRQDTLSIKETDSIEFKVSASDLNKDALSYEWFLDDKKVADGQEFTYDTTYNDAGSHRITASVSDVISSASKEWQVNAQNVDVEGLLNGISDVAVNENEVVKLKLPNFEKYGLAYSISEPLSKNEWKTAYQDAGAYEFKVHAEGKGFSGDKIVKVIVNDVDRAPFFEKVENKVINENEEVKITLSANEPDGDEITYSANNLPEGAMLEGNVFAWKTNFDTVRKEGFVDKVMDKFRVLSKSFYVQFIASSKDKKIIQNIIITVKDVNRAPLIEDMEPIAINEGETLKIVPKAYDLDENKITLRYSGFMDSDTFNSGYDDAGIYYVKVTASDGLLETSKFVQINIQQTNRAPLFGKIESVKAMEGDNIAILLNAHDPDGDEMTFRIDNAPEDYSIKGNAFLWTPSFDIANKKETKKLDLIFVASDGKAETRQIAKVEVTDKNRAPKIIDSTKSVIARANQPVLLFVKAVDDDGDELTYTWNFGLLEKYKATSSHQRTFTSKGTKVIKVTVSDGIEKVEQIMNVNVV
ncbi:PKD domain-containing protein [Candidatus Woesearchaeota archaeon]|nr:PKD domain-containing protein [Candidatus Woesearchaeota archaeon]